MPVQQHMHTAYDGAIGPSVLHHVWEPTAFGLLYVSPATRFRSHPSAETQSVTVGDLVTVFSLDEFSTGETRKMSLLTYYVACIYIDYRQSTYETEDENKQVKRILKFNDDESGARVCVVRFMHAVIDKSDSVSTIFVPLSRIHTIQHSSPGDRLKLVASLDYAQIFQKLQEQHLGVRRGGPDDSIIDYGICDDAPAAYYDPAVQAQLPNLCHRKYPSHHEH